LIKDILQMCECGIAGRDQADRMSGLEVPKPGYPWRQTARIILLFQAGSKTRT